MNLHELRGLVGNQPELEMIHDDQERAAAYRWVARGLSAQSAAKKIKLGRTTRQGSTLQQLMDLIEQEPTVVSLGVADWLN
jgi:hypothetical protein